MSRSRQDEPMEENDIEQNVPEEEMIPFDSLEAQSCPLCAATKAEAEELRLRSLAEMENFKKRLQREKDEHLKYAAEPVLADILPVLDNLDLAIQYGGNNEACKDLLTGIVMTQKVLLDALKLHGLVPIGEVGEVFDPTMHEAVAQAPRNDMPAGCVAILHQRGYQLKERLLRPAKVAVSITQS